MKLFIWRSYLVFFLFSNIWGEISEVLNALMFFISAIYLVCIVFCSGDNEQREKLLDEVLKKYKEDLEKNKDKFIQELYGFHTQDSA